MKNQNYKRVALIGLDGSGKSANIERMKTDVDYSDFSFMWVRWKPTLLKPAYWFLGKNINNKKADVLQKDESEGSIVKNSVEQQKLKADYNAKSGIKNKIFKNPLIRGAWMALALIDYFFQFHFKTFKAIVTKKNIIFDRFYLDLFVDQGINFGYSPKKIDREIKKYQFLFPKMNQIVYIRVSPETCYKRKDDIPNLDYLNRRYEIYEELCKNPGWVIVDGEEAFETVNLNIKKLVL
ncbi:MAG: hypothetical protein IJO83_00150 [Clostridia bacterium]|nr:hypothetical protein [Clostridia bacterium]